MVSDGLSNTLMIMELSRRGVSLYGATQLLAGEIVSALSDRLKITEFIHAEKNQDIAVENDETHRVGHDRVAGAAMGGPRAEFMRKAGISPQGVRQVLLSQPVSGLNDRLQLVIVVAAITGDGKLLGNLI